MISSSKAYQSAITGKSRRIYIKTVIDISDPDMTGEKVSGSPQASFSVPEELLDRVTDPLKRYATLEPGRWLLDGTFSIFPDSYKVSNAGYVLSELSGPDGAFTTPQIVELSFSGVSILQALSVFFSSDEVDGVAADFKVEVFAGQQVFFTKEFSGNTESAVSIDGFTVHIPTAIKVTITKWSLPGRRVRMVELVPGLYEEWHGAAIASFQMQQQADFSCITLPYGTLNLSIDNSKKRFEPRRKESLFQSIEARQGIEVYIGVRLPDQSVEYRPAGVYYQSGDGWKTSNNEITIDWSLVDIVGLLAERTFIPPSSLPSTLDGWIKALVSQLGVNFQARYHVDPAYSGKSVTTSADKLQDVSCGDVLRWVCMATGTWPRADAETGFLAVEPLWNQGNKVLLTALEQYPSMSANESVAALIFDLSNGTRRVISGNATASEKTITISNPFLHTQDQALAAARLILSCYGGNVLNLTGRGDPVSELGDVDTVWLDESNATTARRKMQTFQLQNGVLQGCQSRLLQADGSYLYEAFAVIRQDGPWQAPEGVTRLRVVIGSGGQGGGRGQDGFVGGSGNIPGSGVSSGEGKPGVDGQGGRIWYGVIDINPGQIFQVKLGAGGAPGGVYGSAGSLGADTTFGPYSSANGKYYETGYTDIANGQVFARTGVPAPLPGTADGGKGGKGGEPGEGYWEQLFWDHDNDGDGKPDSRGWEFVVTKPPGPGQPGVPGASGFVMVTWDKPA